MIESVTVVVSALAAGAGVGVADVASTAVMDAYQALKDLVLGRLQGAGTDRNAGEKLFQEVRTSDGRVALVEALEGAGVDEPTEQAARELLELLEMERKAKFHVDASQAKGVYIGDSGTQHNHYS